MNIRKAIEGYLGNLREHDEPIPPTILEEIVELAVCVRSRFSLVGNG